MSEHDEAHPSDAPEQEPPGHREYRQDGYDIGVVFKTPFDDERWIPKVIVMGLIGLIPLVGWLNLLGWVKASFEARKAEALDLPEAGFHYIGAGFRIFLAFLPLGLIVAVLQGILGALGGDGIIGGLFGLVAFVISVAFALLSPAILYVAIKDDDLAASVRVQRLKGIVVGGATSSYLLLVVTMLLLSLFANAGTLLLCVGALFTTPLSAAMAGIALAEFDGDR